MRLEARYILNYDARLKLVLVTLVLVLAAHCELHPPGELCLWDGVAFLPRSSLVWLGTGAICCWVPLRADPAYMGKPTWIVLASCMGPLLHYAQCHSELVPVVPANEVPAVGDS